MPQPRELTDRYRLEKILGSSRGGTVLRAGDLRSGQMVAIKLITIEGVADPARAQAFSRYAGELAALRLPGLPAVLDHGFTADGSAFLVCELLSGAGLDTLAGSAPERILPLLGQALDGLEALAAHGLSHHNVTPANLLVVSAGAAAGGAARDGSSRAGEQVKLLGLGSAMFRMPEAAAAGAATASSGEAARFQAPELIRPGGGANGRADLYALAVTACQVLGATIVFGDSGGPGVQMPLALSFDLANDEALRRILEACLRQNPAERPSHRDVREGLRLALGDAAAPSSPVAVQSPPTATATPTAMKRVGTWPAVDVPTDWRVVEPPPVWPAAAAAAAAPPGQPVTSPDPVQATLSGLRPPDLPHLDATLERPEDHLSASQADLFFSPAADFMGRLAALPAKESPGLPPDHLPASGLPRDDLSALPADHLAGLPRDELAAISANALSVPPADDLRALAVNDLPALPALPPDDLPALAAGPAPAPAAPAEDFPAVDLPRWRRSTVPDDLAGTAAQVLAALSGEEVPAPFVQAAYSSAKATAPPGERRGAVAGIGPDAGSAAAATPAPSLSSPSFFPSASPSAASTPAVGGAAAAGARAAPAALPAPPPAPESGEMLTFDEELLNSLAPPQASAAMPAPRRPLDPKGKKGPQRGAPPPAAVAAGTAAATAMVAAVEDGRIAKWAAALAAHLRRLPRPVLLGGAAAGLIVLGLAAFLLTRGPSPAETSAATVEAPPPPPPPPVESARAKLALAKSYLGEGRSGDPQLRAALASLSFAEQAALPPGGCNEIGALEQTLTLGARETVPADLAAGLRGGDLGLLAAVTDVGSERDVPPAMRADFARARGLVALYREAQAAARRGDSPQVLQRFRALEGMQKNLRDPRELRAHAAAALESSAAALGSDGRYAEALTRLEAVQASWPERTGIKDLVKSCQQYARDEEAQKAILDGLPSYERRRKPAEALDVLRGLKPTPHLAAPFEAARKRLADQLAQLDAQPPQVKLRDGFLLEYSRGTVVTLSFRVTDDYQVRSVRMLARPQGGRMRELALRKNGLAYSVDLAPSFHQNGTVDFYVVATDLSGHEGYLGTADRPLQLKRRQGFERMLH